MQYCAALAFCEPTEFVALARACEDAGFGGVIVSDHLLYPADLRTPYPYTRDGRPRWQADTPWPEPLIAATAMAAATERLHCFVSVLVLPLRHPVQAAKQIATASLFCGGRLTIGIGAGWMRDEFEVLGIPFAGRGRRVEESIEVLRKLWSGEMVEHQGPCFDFPAIQMRPAPPRPVPLFGGGTSEAALDRAARLCDGWASEIQTVEELERIVPRLRALRREAGRPAEFGILAAVKAFYTPESCAGFAKLGLSHLITVPWLQYGLPYEAPLDERLDCIARFGREFIER